MGQGKYKVSLDIFLWHKIRKCLKTNGDIAKVYRARLKGFLLTKYDNNEIYHTEFFCDLWVYCDFSAKAVGEEEERQALLS